MTLDCRRNNPFDLTRSGALTPLIEVGLVIDESIVVRVNLKLEGENVFGSIKDRPAAFLLADAEKKGLLKKGCTIIESTSGNLGAAVASICRMEGYAFVAVVDPKTTPENLSRLVQAGAILEMVDMPDKTGGFLLSRLERVRHLCRQNPHYVWLNQYENPANPQAHYLSTAPEIFLQMQEPIELIFVPVSTGGTLAGLSQFFRRFSPKTRLVAVDAMGSIALGGQPAPRKLTGIGSSRRSEFLKDGSFDYLVRVTDHEAFACCSRMNQATSIKVGGSSGAVLAACVKFLARHQGSYRHVVCLCADRGENYNSTIFNEDWLTANGFAGDPSDFPTFSIGAETAPAFGPTNWQQVSPHKERSSWI